jgi:integrase
MKKQKPIRAKWPRVLRVSNHGADRYLVDSRRNGFSQSRRTFYESEAEALATAEQLERIMRNEGARGFVDLSPEQRGDAAEAIAILARHDASLVTAARHYVGYLDAERKRAIGPSVKEALAGYLKAKEAETERGELARLTYWDLTTKANTIRDAFGEKRVTDIDRSMIENFLAVLHLKPRSKANVRLKFSQFLNWCVRKKIVAGNVASEIKIKVPAIDVQILTVKEAKDLLRNSEDRLLPYIAIGLFSGIRPGECAQLKWEDIDLGNRQITVRGATSKTRETRYVTILPTLAAWLKPFRQKSGPIVRGRINASWPKNALRHSFASYWLPIHQNRAALAELMGNSVSVIKTNYRRAIPARVAKEFWAIRPKASKPTKSEIIIPFPLLRDKAVAAR